MTSLLLPNTLRVITLQDNSVEVTVVENTETEETEEKDDDCDTDNDNIDKKRRKTTSSVDNTAKFDTTESSTTPDNVLQYQRQLRKFQANQKSLQELTVEKHLKVVYEDNSIIVVNKPSGILCVPGLNNKPNVLNLICQHCKLPTDNISQYIVHRLDMDTSGIVVFAKSLDIQKQLHTIFRERDMIEKKYTALLCGHLPYDKGHIHLPIQKDHQYPPFMRIATPKSEMEAAQAVLDLKKSPKFRKLIKKNPKPSHTEFTVIQREFLKFDSKEEEKDGNESTNSVEIPVTRVSLVPHTGRTHQLRVHCASIGYPIVGDPAYGLYGEANPHGGLDIIDNAVEQKEDSSSSTKSLMQIQKLLLKYRPITVEAEGSSKVNEEESPATMCLHSTKLALKQHPMTGKAIEWIVPPPF